MFKSFKFLGAHVVDQITSDVISGGNQERKILPECETPRPDSPSRKCADLSDEEKISAVLEDPRFGMLSLFKYHVVSGTNTSELRKLNTVFCSHIFSLIIALPIWIYIVQWVLLIALIMYKNRNYSGGLCPSVSSVEHRLIIAGVSLLYFIKSFFLLDSFTQRTQNKKLMPVKDLWVILDTLQEFGFALLTYAVNLWVIFIEKDLQNMLMDCLAIEFLMLLDNEFEETYFKFLPRVAIDLYDKTFVNYGENKVIINQIMENSECFRCSRALTYLPLKLLLVGLLIFPFICFIMIFYGPICK